MLPTQKHLAHLLDHVVQTLALRTPELIIDGTDFQDIVLMDIGNGLISLEQLPEDIGAAYVLVQREVYFLCKEHQTCTVIASLSDEQYQTLKNDFPFHSLNINNNDCPTYLLHSQVVAIEALLKHRRQRHYLKFSKREYWTCTCSSLEQSLGEAQAPLNSLLSGLYFMLQKAYPLPVADAFDEDAEAAHVPKKSWWDWAKEGAIFPFSTVLRHGLRWTFLDNPVIKQTVGRIIAGIANHGNPHYAAQPETTSQLLSHLIFPGGAQTIRFDAKGYACLDRTLSRQLLALVHAELHYHPESGRYRYDYTFVPFKIRMPDNTIVAGVSARNRTAEKISDSKKDIIHLIYFNGNSGCYQEELPLDAHTLGEYDKRGLPVEWIRFNYPGVVNSTGYPHTAECLVQSGIAQVWRLLNKGIPPQHIQLLGNSLGGCISTLVMKHFYDSGMTLSALCVSRTFASTTSVGCSYVERVPYVGGVLSVCFRPFIAFGLWGTGWHLNTAKSYASLPDEHVWYTQARSKQHVGAKDDTVLNRSCDLHGAWQLQLKRWLARHGGFFGYNRQQLNANNRAHKLSAYRGGVPDPQQCAHADALCFGCSMDLSQGTLQSRNEHSPLLLARSHKPHENSEGEQPPDELGEQTIEWVRVHVPKAVGEASGMPLSGNRFSTFFMDPNQRSSVNTVASDFVRGMLGYL